jgi:Carboxypeptidase regulatory-like domain/Secretion system C-terminal sorting domain/von Willebrand factor type A domain
MKKIFYLFICLFAATTLFAQTGGIQGKVTDTKGEALIGAAVSATSTAAGRANYGTVTDVDGNYHLIMPIGTYSIDISFVGYQTKKITNLEVKKSPLTTYDFVLEESAALSEVVVTAMGAKRSTKSLGHASSSAPTKSAKKSATRGADAPKSSVPMYSAMPAPPPPPPAKRKSYSDATAYGAAKTTEKTVVYDKKVAEAKESKKVAEALNSKVAGIEVSKPSVDSEKTTKAEKGVTEDSPDDKVSLDDLHKTKPTFLESAAAKDKAAADAAKAVADADESLPDEPEERAGQLTAGEWSDLKNWNFWLRSIDTAFSTYHKNWKYNFDDRYSVNVVGTENQPIADAQVRLLATDGTLVWESRTDNHGNAELWSGLFGGKYTNLVFKVLHNGKTFDFKNAKTFKTSVNTLKINASCSGLMALDIAFVVDATGSMGDEIAYLKSEVVDVIRRVKMNNQSLEIRTASVFYRDFSDDYVTRIFPFGKSLKQNLAFIRNQSAGGGGDFEEAVPEGLESGIDSLKWSENALARIMFLILDAPPHLTPENTEKLHRLTQKAAQKGIRIIPITASGIDKNVEYLMKTLGVTTGGTYVFLTDDSGIGGGHIKATTEKHEVEHLNDLMVRLIKDATDTETCRKIAEKASTGGDAILDASFKLSPTPASSIVYVDMKNDIESLRITNVHGQIMEDLYDLKAGTKEIAVSTWASGVYYATIKQGKTVSTKKFSVIR